MPSQYDESNDFELKITIDYRVCSYALLIKHDGKSSLTFYDTLTAAKNAISVILLEFNI